ncbi:N-acetylglucosamine kinase [uncultured Arthrobacter sp.]|nr:BadF/BadG/BcrA/BcrD ATPase family protein [uncultured Arthrobacter sp.]
MGTMNAAVLAIDGGNSKTDVALIASSGEVLSHVRGPGSSPHFLGLEGCVDLLDGLVARAAAQAGFDGAVGVAESAGAYLAGADLPGETAELTKALAARGWAGETVVDNDTFALLRAGTDDRDAVAVVCGAGINCVGVTSDGRQARFPSLGRISGDWGGGMQLGDEALWWAARAIDGRGEPTSLVHLISERFRAGSLAEVIEALHYRRLDPAELRTLAPVVLRAASDGDAVAVRIVERQAEEVVVLALAALRRLELLEKPTTVVLGGGVLTSGNDLLHNGIRRGLRADAPLAVAHSTGSAPIVGAALLGLDRLGADRESESRLRASFARILSGTDPRGPVGSAAH